MSDNHNASRLFSKDSIFKETKPHDKKIKKKRINWHEAVSFAIQIDLKEYTSLLEYKSEYILGKNSYRIDLLIIKKLTKEVIPKKLRLFLEILIYLR